MIAFSRVMRFSSVVSLLLLVFVFSYFPIQSRDIFMYLALGKKFFLNNGVPSSDPFMMHAENIPWPMGYSWLAYALAYAFFTEFGFNGLIILKAIICILFIYQILLYLKVKKSLGPVSMILLALMLIPMSTRFYLRTSLISSLLVVTIFILILLDHHKCLKNNWPIPLLFIFWCNFHPGFYGGLFLLASVSLYYGIMWFWSKKKIHKLKTKKWVYVLFLSVLACTLNPKGIGGLLFPLKPFLSKNWITETVYEMQPIINLGLLSKGQYVIFFCLSLLVIIMAMLQILKEKKNTFLYYKLGLVIFFFFLPMLKASRYILIASAIIAIVGCELIAKSTIHKKIKNEHRDILNGFISVVFLVSSYIMFFNGFDSGQRKKYPSRTSTYPLDLKIHPVEHALMISKLNHPNLKILNTYSLGTFLCWYFEGSPKVFSHGYYSDSQFYKNFYLDKIYTKKGVDKLLSEEKFDVIILETVMQKKKDMPLLYKKVLSSPDYNLVKNNWSAMLFIRKELRSVPSVN